MQIEFVQMYKVDSCPRHCKVLLDMYNIHISSSEPTLTKNQARILLKRIFHDNLVLGIYINSELSMELKMKVMEIVITILQMKCYLQ
jgi:hypothetical protein